MKISLLQPAPLKASIPLTNRFKVGQSIRVQTIKSYGPNGNYWEIVDFKVLAVTPTYLDVLDKVGATYRLEDIDDNPMDTINILPNGIFSSLFKK
jgi:hypothetical protein